LIKSLLEILNDKDSSGSLASKLAEIRAEAKPLLDKIPAIFPEYTPHDIEHKDRVIDNMRLIIPKSLVDEMNAKEVFFLLAAAYVHDVGMADLEGLEQFSARNLEGREQTDFIRDQHHLRSEEFVTKFHRAMKIDRISDARIIGRIARGHRVDDLRDEELYDRKSALGGDITVNVALLAMVLRIADELDLSFTRIPMIVYEHIPPIDHISRHEWEKHNTCSPPTLISEEQALVVSADCFSSEVHRSLKRLEDKVNEQIELYPELLHKYSACRKDLPRTFEIRITPHDYKPRDFRFSLNEKHIARLLMGEQLYSDVSEGIREILKNSVDACRHRKALLTTDNPHFLPYIGFELSADRRTLKIYDNGIGMDEDFVERYLTKIGNSFYQSNEFVGKKYNFTPVGELGIGLLSYFMIADEVLIDTKTDNEKPLKIEIKDISKYFIISDGSRSETGTTVTLQLKEAISHSIDLESWVRRYAKHIEFEIEVRQGGTKKSVISDGGFRCDYSDLFAKSHTDPREYYSLRKIHINTPEMVGIIGILVPTKAFDVDTWNTTDMRHSEKKQVSISHNGILVSENANDILVEGIETSQLFLNIDLKKKIVDLNAARNTIVDNYKSSRLRKEVSDHVAKKIGSFVSNKFPGGASKHEGSEINRFLRFYLDLDRLGNRSASDRKNPRLSEALEIMNPMLLKCAYLRVVKDSNFSYKTFTQIRSESFVVVGDIDRVTDHYLRELFSKSRIIRKCIVVGPTQISLFSELQGVYPLTEFFNISDSRHIELAGISIPTNQFLNSKIQTLGLHWSYLITKAPDPWLVSAFSYNRNHPFVDLIISKLGNLSMADKVFCALVFSEIETLRSDTFLRHRNKKESYQKVLRIQKQALDQLVRSSLIRKASVLRYIITEEDFATVI
jgi:hypothetical protein